MFVDKDTGNFVVDELLNEGSGLFFVGFEVGIQGLLPEDICQCADYFVAGDGFVFDSNGHTAANRGQACGLGVRHQGKLGIGQLFFLFAAANQKKR
jgi:hypothetical protein